MLLTRPPLSLISVQVLLLNFARLACVRHAASVHPEPGSNSQKKSLRALRLLFTFIYKLMFELTLARYSCIVFYCNSYYSIFKVRAPLARRFAILPSPPPSVNTFFQHFAFLFATRPGVSQPPSPSKPAISASRYFQLRFIVDSYMF